MDNVTFYFTDGSDVSFSTPPEATAVIDSQLTWTSAATSYFVQFTDAGGVDQRINLVQLRRVSIERGVTS